MNTEQYLDAEMEKAVPTTEKNEMRQNTAQNPDKKTRKTVPTIEKNEAQQTKKVRLPLELKDIKILEMIEKERKSLMASLLLSLSIKRNETNRGRLLMEQKDIKDLEFIEKEEVPEGKQANTALDSLKSNESSSSAIVKTEKMAADAEHGTYPHISASENVEKDTGNKASPQVSASKYVRKIWTCDICQLTMYGSNSNSHLQGKKHKAAYEVLNTKTKGTAGTYTGNGASPHVSVDKKVQKIWTCGICQFTMISYTEFNSHLQGKKHKTACEALNTKTKATAGTDTGNEASPQVSAYKKVQKIWTCEICQLTMLEGNMSSHLQGKKHKGILLFS